MAISSPGIGSGLDVSSIVSQLMAIEKQPLQKLDSKEASYQSTITALGSLKGTLSSLQSALASLTKVSTFAGSYKTSSSDTSVVTATASDSATAGSYNISVQQLAQSQKLRTNGTYSGTGAAFGSGTITIQFGTTTPDPLDPDPSNLTLPGTFVANPAKATVSVTIDPSKATLLDVRNAINSAKGGVTASIVNDGTGYRLAISSDDTGAANSMKITVTDGDGNSTDATGLSALAFDPTATRNLKISQSAKDAIFSVDGIPIVKPSNTVSDAIDGITLTLLKDTGTSKVGVTFDRSGIAGAIQAFAKAYNETNKQLRELTAYNAETKERGALQGDPTARSIQARLRTVLQGNLSFSAGGAGNLAQIGISFDRNGNMTVDQGKLNAAVNDPAQDIAPLFAAIATSTDSFVKVKSTPTTLAAGKYDVAVSTLATRGTMTADLSTRTIVAGNNDSFSVRIDGVTASVTLAAGSYTGSALAAEIQSKLNGVAGLKSAGGSVVVEFASGGAGETLTITSNRYGSTSTVTAVSSAILANAASTAGVNVAGTIAGHPATGAGQTLTGSGPVNNLALTITGTTTGSRGSVHYDTGFAKRLDLLIDNLVSAKGVIASKTEGIQDSIKGLDDRRTELNRRLVQVEARYRRQFTSLDSIMQQMTATQNSLTQQLSRLNQQ